MYKKAIKDHSLAQVTPKNSAYGDTSPPVVGTVLLRVWRGDYQCKLDCRLVDSPDIYPILGRKACVEMNIVAYMDNDALSKLNTDNVNVFALHTESPATPKFLEV